MIQSLTYNVDPESLGGISQDEFSEAFEAEFIKHPKYAETNVSVTFMPGKRGVTTWHWDGDEGDLDNDLIGDFDRLANDAWNACLLGNPMTPECVVEFMLTLSPERRVKFLGKIDDNPYFCIYCGIGSRDTPNNGCHCINDE